MKYIINTEQHILKRMVINQNKKTKLERQNAQGSIISNILKELVFEARNIDEIKQKTSFE